MTKTELMENYTSEQLADIVIELESELKTARNLENEVLFEERIANNIRNATGMNIDDVRKAVQDTKKYMNDTYTEEIKNQIEHMKSEVDKYRKAFEYAKKERDRQIAEYQKKIKEMDDRAILEFPTEPIDVANFLINGLGASWHYDSFGLSELRQVAEHLLVYCNHNGEAEK